PKVWMAGFRASRKLLSGLVIIGRLRKPADLEHVDLDTGCGQKFPTGSEARHPNFRAAARSHRYTLKAGWCFRIHDVRSQRSLWARTIISSASASEMAPARS